MIPAAFHLISDRNQIGFILVTFLIFLTICLLLGISVFSTSLMEVLISNNFHQQRKNFLLAESALRTVERTISEHGNYACYASESLPSNYFQGQDYTWWKSKACQGNFKGNSFYYFIENMGKIMCTVVNKLHINDVNNQGVVYYRITVRLADMNDYDRFVTMLQSTYVLPTTTEHSCDQVRQINSGRQSWRSLV